jgi:UDP-N-acetylmuramoyl-L-alanyl-D-glutamate--2,6-diaminopimelate ligase
MIKKIGKRLLGPIFSPGSFLYESYHLCRGIAATCIYQFPSREMVVIGVTGTNGKTTTANLIAQILKTAGHKVGLSTTVNFWVGDKQSVNETKMTTDNPFTLQQRIRAMADAGAEYAVIETASHALAQHRTWGIAYDVAVFTNLTHDHLDYHKSFEAYRDAKLKLFRQTFQSFKKPNVDKLAIINLSDESSSHFAKSFPGAKFFYAVEKFDQTDTLESPITVRILSSDASGSVLQIQTPTGDIKINLPLPGNFNIENALSAASTCYALGISLEKIKEGLEQAPSIPGRLEPISAGQSFSVIVDYAHNPDGFDKALSSLRAITSGRLIVVFGSAGDRDKAKRPILGRVASHYADIIYLTEEDPGSEDPLKIISAIRPGISNDFLENKNLFIIPKRTEAIEAAIRMAQPRDTVVALAMGAQTVMSTKSGTIPYNEREFIKNLLHSIIKSA